MESAVLEFVQAREVVVLGTVGQHGVQVAAVHYAVDASGSLLFKSRSDSDHIIAIQSNPEAAAVIYEHSSTFDTKAGVQLKGKIVRIAEIYEMNAAVELYSAKFPAARAKFDSISTLVSEDAPSTLYRFVPGVYKFIDGWSGGRFDRQYLAW